MTVIGRVAVAVVAAALVASGCTGSAASHGTVSPPSAPALIDYAPTSGVFAIRVPAGWVRTAVAEATVFADRLGSLRIEQIPYGSASSEASFQADELPTLRRMTPGFRLRRVATVSLPAGTAILAEYAATATDPVTGRPVAQEVHRYELWHADQRAVLTLTGRGAWATILRSFRWRR